MSEGYYVIAQSRPEDGEEPGILNSKRPKKYDGYKEAQKIAQEKTNSPSNEGFPFVVMSEAEALALGYLDDEDVSQHRRERSLQDRERDRW